MEYLGMLVFATYCLSFISVTLCEDAKEDTFLMHTVQRFLNARRLQKRSAMNYDDVDERDINDLIGRLKRVKRGVTWYHGGHRATSSTSTTTTTAPPPPTNPPSTQAPTQAPTTTPTTLAPFKLPDFPKGFFWGKPKNPGTGMFGNSWPGTGIFGSKIPGFGIFGK